MANYIDNDELEAEIRAWRDSAERPEDRVPSERLGQLLLALHDGVLSHPNFNRYSQELKDDMKSYSLYRILKTGLRSFSPGRAKAFSYFTKAAFSNYVTVLKKHYKELNFRRQYAKNALERLQERDPGVAAYVRHFQVWEG